MTRDPLMGNFPSLDRFVPSLPDMALFSRKQKTAVGLDIGSGLIKVAVMDHRGAEPELVRVALVPFVAQVNIGNEASHLAWIDQTGAAPYNGEILEDRTIALQAVRDLPRELLHHLDIRRGQHGRFRDRI